MALALRPIWRAAFNFTTSPAIVSATWPPSTPPTPLANPNGTASGAVYPYPAIYSVGPTKAALIKSIILTNVTTQDLVVEGIYTGFRTTIPAAIGDLTAPPAHGIYSFQRVAPKDLRVPAGQQIVLDTEIVMMGMNILNVPSSGLTTAHNDYLIFVAGVATVAVAGGIHCVVNGAERDQV